MFSFSLFNGRETDPSILPTPLYFYGPKTDQEYHLEIEKGKSLMIDTIQSILLEKKNQSIELNELLFLINHRTKHQWKYSSCTI